MSAPSTGRRGAAPSPARAAGGRAAGGRAAGGRAGESTASPAAEGPVEARSRWPLYLAVAVAAAVMAVLGVWGLARRGTMGNDEIASRWAASLSLRQLLHLLRHVDAVHGLYYLLLHGWMVFGTTPTIIRIPSVIIMTAAAGLIVVVGRRLTGSVWAGLFAGLIMAFDPVISFYAQTARSYAMVFFCVLATTLALVWALEAEAAGRSGAPLARRWVLYGALVTLGGYLNELSLLVLAAHAATVLLTRYGWRTIRHWVVVGAIGGFLVLPVLVLSVKEDAAEGWLAPPGAHDLGILFHDYFGATNLVAGFMLAFAVFAVLPAARLPAIRVWRPRPASGAGPESAWWKRGGFSLPSVAAPLLVLPAGLAIVESWVGKPVYADRYFLYGEAGAALLSGAGVYRIGQWIGPWLARHLGTGTVGSSTVGSSTVGSSTAGGASGWRSLVWLPGVIVCVFALVLQLAPQQRVRTAQSREFDYGDPAFYIGARAHPGDGVLFFNTFYRKIRLGYPGDFKDVTDFAMAKSPAQVGNFNGINKPWPEIRSLMLTYQRIWVVGRAPSAHVSSPAIRNEGKLLLSQFRLIAKRHFKGMVVTLWLRR